MSKSHATEHDVSSMSVRAAWLHYAGGLTQAEVARKLGLTSLKAHRLITKANNEGLVKVYIDGDIAECVSLEEALSEQHGLTYCEVVPDLEETNLPLKALGIAGAQFLKRTIEHSEHRSIGIGHGRTLAACAHCLPRVHQPDKQIVSLLGGFSKKFSANPPDVIHLLAQRTDAIAYVMPVPFFANSLEDKNVILQQYGIREVLQLASKTSIKIAGIGSISADAYMVANAMLDEKDIYAVYKAGARGEILGHFFGADGQLVETELSQRTMGLSAAELSNTNLMAVAGGDTKVEAITAILKSGLLSGLITDERTARALIYTR